MAKNVKINSVIYAEVPQVSIPLAEGEGTAVFYDTSGATASSGDILIGKSAFLGNGAVTGTMSNNGAVSGSIAKADGAYTIPAGFHNGSGSVRISKEEQAKLVSGNIKSGVTVLASAASPAWSIPVMPLRLRGRLSAVRRPISTAPR
uniref:Tail protein n=1 Tax=Siphoviridae sp. ctx7r16 TaxID=2825738 RepID=A0A8S5NWR9_9CAUD|nr:MAG TPA: tail protein [Siphoviridae sp. ctx7r16]